MIILVFMPTVLSIIAILMMQKYGFDKTKLSVAAAAGCWFLIFSSKRLHFDMTASINTGFLGAAAMYALMLVLYKRKNKS